MTVKISPVFSDVVAALDRAVDGADIGAHGPFWRDISRDKFVERKVSGRQLLVVGNATESNIIKALRGILPFGSDTGNPDADLPRMPAFMGAMAPEDIDLIAAWIDQGCPA